MSTPITPTANIPPATYPIPAPGESVSSANTAQFVQPLADAIAWLRARVPGANAPASVLRVCSSSERFETSGWTTTTGFRQVNQADVSIAWGLEILLNVTPGAVVRAFRASVQAQAHGALPASMPTLTLWRVDTSTGARVQVGTTATDPSGSTGAYAAYHTISQALGTPLTLGANEQLYMVLTGESGANSVVGLHYFNGSVDVSSL